MEHLCLESGICLSRDSMYMINERILGDSEVLYTILSQSKEKYLSRYELRRHSYDLDRIAERV